MKRLLWTLLVLVAGCLVLGWLRPGWMLEAWLRLQALAAGADVETVEAGGWRWTYLEAGEGPATLVLLHGFTGMKENWLPVIPALADRYRVLAPDFPHTDPSQRRAGMDLGYDAHAERLHGFLEATVDGPLVLVGHSMGGGVAAVHAARHPQALAALVLVDAGGVRFADNEFGQAVLRGDNPFAVDDRESLDRYLETLFADPPPVPWPLDRALLERRRRDAGFEQRVLDAIGRGEGAFLPGESAGAIGVPTLLLWCRDDRVIDRSAAAIYAERIADSEIRMLDGCNHMPMMERPSATADAIASFLAPRLP